MILTLLPPDSDLGLGNSWGRLAGTLGEGVGKGGVEDSVLLGECRLPPGSVPPQPPTALLPRQDMCSQVMAEEPSPQHTARSL